jgi:hypothetical protein
VGLDMAWCGLNSISFTRIQVASQVPSDSGVYAINDGGCCIFVGESWNLRARLLELASVLSDVEHLTIAYELCPEDELADRKNAVARELLGEQPQHSVPPNSLPGISFRL